MNLEIFELHMMLIDLGIVYLVIMLYVEDELIMILCGLVILWDSNRMLRLCRWLDAMLLGEVDEEVVLE